MKTTKFFAVINNYNGPISRELTATTETDAVREVKSAVADKSAVAWLDDNQTALEDAFYVCCDDLSYVWGEPGDDKWNIWSVTEGACEIEIVSGEGTGEGTVEEYDGEQTHLAVLDRLTTERCNGDRWAFAVIDGERCNGEHGDDRVRELLTHSP
jgi:hypothetical protein